MSMRLLLAALSITSTAGCSAENAEQTSADICLPAKGDVLKNGLIATAIVDGVNGDFKIYEMCFRGEKLKELQPDGSPQ